jgi:hypothetical protein
VGHVARLGEMRNSYIILVGKSERKRPLGELGVDGRITLDWILGKQRGRVRIGCVCLRVGTSAGPL